jgi:glycosyltransferase involved in cell wall biosynthesis
VLVAAPGAAAAGATGLPHLCLVGPLAPPAAGMANQCAELARVLRAQGLQVELVQTNPAYRPHWVARVAGLRALCRLLPFVWRLWRALGRCEVVHVLANSGWAWHLFAAPALVLARLRRRPAIVHYHGGNAQAFLARAPCGAHRLLAGSALRVLPSAYLQRVFARHGLHAEVIPNGLDLDRFAPRRTTLAQPMAEGPVQLLVSRNLEPIYGIDTAIRAFARVHARLPGARLVIAGGGSQHAALQALVRQLQLGAVVHFAGRIAHHAMPALLAQTTCLLNPSRVDNMPVSILEAFACGVPVVSTRAGGIPDMLQHGHTGLLVDVDDEAAMAAQLLRVLQDTALARRLGQAGRAQAEQYAWARVKPLWLAAYQRALGQPVGSSGCAVRALP